MNIYKIQKGLKYLKHYGIKDFLIRLQEKRSQNPEIYQAWFQNQLLTSEELKTQKEEEFLKYPKISIVVPIYMTDENFLRAMIESVMNQTYGNWELCLADGSDRPTAVGEIITEYVKQDERIRYQKLSMNLGIAENTNQAIAMAQGDYIGLLDHDDILAVNALYEIAKVIEDKGNIDLIYTDEDKISSDSDRHFDPHFKPDFNMDLLRSNNYICHFLVIRKEIVNISKGFLKEFDGAQDYDFIFRCVEVSKTIEHIPKVLYHWRVHGESTADNPHSKLYAYQAGNKAIGAHLDRQGMKADVYNTKDLGFYHVKYKVDTNALVSVIIIVRDSVKKNVDILHQAMSKSGYHNYEILMVVEKSLNVKKHELSQRLRNLKIIEWDQADDDSAMLDAGARAANGEYLVFLSSDIKKISEGWMDELLGNILRKEVGIVGGKSYCGDYQIRQAGYTTEYQAITKNLFKGIKKGYSGYLHKAALRQQVRAVSIDCLMVRNSVYQTIGGVELDLKSEYIDLDLCLKIEQLGLAVVFTPYIEIYLDKKKNEEILSSDQKVIRKKWKEELLVKDRFYNRNLSTDHWTIS